MITKTGRSRMIQEMAKLSPGAVKRIQRAGILRGADTMASGLNKGTDNILRQTGFTEKTMQGLSQPELAARLGSGGYAADFTNKQILSSDPKSLLTRASSPFHRLIGTERGKNLRHAMSRRHEAYEALESVKANPDDMALVYKPTTASRLRERLTSQRDKITGGQFATVSETGTPMQRVGVHKNLAVLGRESKDLTNLKAHGLGKAVRPFTKFRDNTGESRLLSKITGKNSDQFMDKGDLSRLRKAPHEMMETTIGYQRGGSILPLRIRVPGHIIQ